MSQLLTSLLTVIGVLVMMFVISPLLALIALVTIPVSLVAHPRRSASAAQKHFVAQWRHTGALNGQIEEAFTGHELVKVFGRQREVEERVPRQERGAVRGQLRRAVHLRASSCRR